MKIIAAMGGEGMDKKKNPLKKDIVALAALLNETDRAARKALTQRAEGSSDLSMLRSCVDQLNRYMTWRDWKEDYVRLKNSIAQGETAVETIKQAVEKKDTDVQGQYKLLNELKNKIGTDPSNHDLIEQVEKLQKTITPETDKTGDILALGKTLEQVAESRRRELQETKAMKKMMDYLFIMVVYEQRLGLCALAKPGALMWSRLARELRIPAPSEQDRISIFDFLGKQKLAPAARKIYDSLCEVINEPVEKAYDFSTKEDRRSVKKDTITKLRKITKLENLCHEALHEDSDQYKELMKAQDVLLTDDAEEMALNEMQERLQTLQKAAQKYMEAQVERGGIFGVPRREARLVYAAALHNFAERFGRQLGEAMMCRDISSLELSGDMTKEYIRNSLQAMNQLVKEQTGVDLVKENKEPEKMADVLTNGMTKLQM